MTSGPGLFCSAVTGCLRQREEGQKREGSREILIHSEAEPLGPDYPTGSHPNTVASGMKSLACTSWGINSNHSIDTYTNVALQAHNPSITICTEHMVHKDMEKLGQSVFSLGSRHIYVSESAHHRTWALCSQVLWQLAASRKVIVKTFWIQTMFSSGSKPVCENEVTQQMNRNIKKRSSSQGLLRFLRRDSEALQLLKVGKEVCIAEWARPLRAYRGHEVSGRHLFCFVFGVRVLLHSPSWPPTCGDLASSASQMLGL